MPQQINHTQVPLNYRMYADQYQVSWINKKDERNEKNIIKAASSDGRDLAPGSPTTGDFRKAGNGEQYVFKKVNIEEYVKVIYMCQTCCQLVALCP